MEARKTYSYYDLTKAARALGIDQHTLWYSVYKRKIVPEPKCKMGKRWYYSGSDFEHVRTLVADLVESGVINPQPKN